MIMGLERLDRIMAFTEEQSGPSGPVDFPPPRHPGRPSTVRGEQGRASGDGQNGQKQNGGVVGSSAREAAAQDRGAGAESSAASRDQLASSSGAGPSGDAMSGRDRVNAAIASVGSREHAPQQETSPDRRKSLTASLDGEVRSRTIEFACWCACRRTRLCSDLLFHAGTRAGLFLPYIETFSAADNAVSAFVSRVHWTEHSCCR